MIGNDLANSLIMRAKSLQEITSYQFADRIVRKKADAVLQISGHQNGASQMFSHNLQAMASQYSHKVNFFSLKNEKETLPSATFRVDNGDTILFFKRGMLVDKLSGLTHRTIISNKIFQLINS
jgi:thioredoxin-like negative regulator of GroEL